MDKEHVLKIIDILYNECISACGDGDALWYSTYYKIEELLPLVQEYNSELSYPFDIMTEDKTIYWIRGQESIIITNDESLYINAPSWQQFLLKT